MPKQGKEERTSSQDYANFPYGGLPNQDPPETSEAPTEEKAATAIETLDGFLGDIALQFERVYQSVTGNLLQVGTSFKEAADQILAGLAARTGAGTVTITPAPESEQIKILTLERESLEIHLKGMYDRNRRLKARLKSQRKLIRHLDRRAPGIHTLWLQNGETLVIMDDLSAEQAESIKVLGPTDGSIPGVAGVFLLGYSVAVLDGHEVSGND